MRHQPLRANPSVGPCHIKCRIARIIGVRDGLARAMCEALDAPPSAHDALRNNARETIVSRYDLQRICLPKQMALVERLALG